MRLILLALDLIWSDSGMCPDHCKQRNTVSSSVLYFIVACGGTLRLNLKINTKINTLNHIGNKIFFFIFSCVFCIFQTKCDRNISWYLFVTVILRVIPYEIYIVIFTQQIIEMSEFSAAGAKSIRNWRKNINYKMISFVVYRFDFTFWTCHLFVWCLSPLFHRIGWKIIYDRMEGPLIDCFECELPSWIIGEMTAQAKYNVFSFFFSKVCFIFSRDTSKIPMDLVIRWLIKWI